MSNPLDPKLKNNWFVAATSGQVRSQKLLRRVVMGVPLVLYRDSKNVPHALEDRCLHKNMPLSEGKIVENTIQCPYHGWRFNENGECVEVPCHARTPEKINKRINSKKTVEQDGWIWVYMGDHLSNDICLSGPPKYPMTKQYKWFELHNLMNAPMDLILENGMDCAHTGFVHDGLYRSKPEQFVKSKISTTERGVLAVTTDEKTTENTKDFRNLLSGDSGIFHSDEYIFPHTIEVKYKTGKNNEVVTILVCTPESNNLTRVYTRMGVNFGIWTWPVTQFIKWLTKKIVAQDRKILEKQTENILAFGDRVFYPVVSDLSTTWLTRYMNQKLRLDKRTSAESENSLEKIAADVLSAEETLLPSGKRGRKEQTIEYRL